MDGLPKPIFDRDDVREQLSWEVTRTPLNLIVVEGESGAGKSAVVEHVLQTEFMEPQIRRFSFRDCIHSDSENSLISFFLSNYLLERKKNRSLASLVKKIELKSGGIALTGPSLSFGMKDLSAAQVGDSFIQQYLKISYENGIRVIHISNCELLSDTQDIRSLSALIQQTNLPIPIVLEIGELKDSFFLKKLFERALLPVTTIRVKPFRKNQANDFFKFIHKTAGPDRVIDKTGGNAFSIIHFNSASLPHNQYEVAKNRIDSLTMNEKEVLFFLAALDGRCDSHTFTQIIEQCTNSSGAISSLLMSNLIIEKNNHVTFTHSFFLKPFQSIELKGHVNTLARKPIIKWLISSNEGNNADRLLAIAAQYQSMEDYSKSCYYSWISLLNAYEQQNYSTALDAANIGVKCSQKESEAYTIFVIIRVQLRIVLGHGGSISDQDLLSLEQRKNSITKLLQIQVLYLNNRFDEALKILKPLIFELDDSTYKLALAFGLGASCAIALGRTIEAKNYYASAKLQAHQLSNPYLKYELMRMSPKIEGWAIGEFELTQVVESKLIDNYEYSKAKILHNLGFTKFINSRGQSGREELEKSRLFFDMHEAPELTYSITAHAIVSILDREYGTAEIDLLDALNLSYEQYDRFSTLTNLANVKMLQKEIESAGKLYYNALAVLKDPIKPLNDPVLLHKAHHNLAIYNLVIGNFVEATLMITKAKVPSIATFFDRRKLKHERIREAIRNKQSDLPMRLDIGSNIEAWPVDEFNFAIAKLSFYDFNARIIDSDNLKLLGNIHGLSTI